MAEQIKPKVIGRKQVLNDLKSGVTRWEKDNLGFGSIEKKYNLTFTEMKTLLADSQIKGVKTVIPSLIIVDDTDAEDVTPKFTNLESEEDSSDLNEGKEEVSQPAKVQMELPIITPPVNVAVKETQKEVQKPVQKQEVIEAFI